jgi:hypothetical protein
MAAGDTTVDTGGEFPQAADQPESGQDGSSGDRESRFPDGPDEFASSITVGSGPYSVDGDLDTLSDDFEWVLLDPPRINDDGPSRRALRVARPVEFLRASVIFTGDRPYFFTV